MSLTAIRSSNPSNELVADDMMQRVVSGTGQELSESHRSSMMEFSRLEVRQPSAHSFTVGVVSTSRKPLRDTLIKVHNLLSWGHNWNSYDALAPDPNAVAHANSWVTSLFRMIENWGLFWIKPSVSASPEGEVVFEWRYGKRKLTIYIGDQSADYVQVWGTDIHAKITEGDIQSISDIHSLWVWLIS